MEFGDWLRRTRRRMKKSQIQIARSAGVTDQFICMVEAGTRSPSLDTASKIARALGHRLRWDVQASSESRNRR